MWTVAQGCSSPVPPDITASDPLLTQNRIGVGKAGRKQRKIRRADGGKKHKSEPKRLRFVLFATVRSADFPLFPPSPARSNPTLGQKWVRGCNIRRDWRTATLRHSPHDLSSYHKWRKGQRFVGVFVHHGSCFGLGDKVKVTTVDILIRCDGVAPW